MRIFIICNPNSLTASSTNNNTTKASHILCSYAAADHNVFYGPKHTIIAHM